MDKSKNNKMLLFLPLVILVVGLAGISFIKSSREVNNVVGKNPSVIKIYKAGEVQEITDQNQCSSIVDLINNSIDMKKLNSSEVKGLDENSDGGIIEESRKNETAVEIVYDADKTIDIAGGSTKYNRLFFQVSNNKVESINGVAYGQGPEYTTLIKIDVSKVKEKLKEAIDKGFK